MYSQRALLCGLVGVITVATVLAAQELRDTIGPLEQKTNPITPGNPIPRRTQGRVLRSRCASVSAASLYRPGS
jgi:hypothetical protein